ncbi:outer membrane lipid asymmetry maintenance protein MlaD [Halotalea alkalilenta]|uniref:Outer membrane lipid asymmetry maintenance protein MlaD n=1 Tax=Halotalea alkalilenta TaxID=376489 RepID=A0A172YE91_9GAMM|nr:outer membrane lipid asymmetry maintenance protein MlaD [Halotalea alkalilenta]ANF57517.1 outer membrane lipid asymmetry maintenance protein MlaD [Halotalea alkalilenta]
MKQRTRLMECGVGLFVLAGFLGLIYLGLQVSGITPGQRGETFTLHANFGDIGGLRANSRVTMAGVTVGRVTAISLDDQWFDGHVTMEISDELRDKLSTDSTAAILTSGLLGEQYVGLTTGADPETLKDGDTIRDTQQALVLENLIQQFISNMGSSGS